MKYQVTIDEKKYEIEINGDGKASVNGRNIDIDLKSLNGGKIHSLLLDNNNFEFELEKSNGGYDLWHRDGQAFVEVTDEKTERLRKLMGGANGIKKQSALKAAMPGLVLQIEVEPGQTVKRGDGLVIIEAMKMENEIKATSSATIKEIKVEPGQAVEKNQVLIVFE